jgi:hypothetical protein
VPRWAGSLKSNRPFSEPAIRLLPADIHSKGLSYDLAFVEAIGGLKTFKLKR